MSGMMDRKQRVLVVCKWRDSGAIVFRDWFPSKSYVAGYIAASNAHETGKLYTYSTKEDLSPYRIAVDIDPRSMKEPNERIKTVMTDKVRQHMKSDDDRIVWLRGSEDPLISLYCFVDGDDFLEGLTNYMKNNHIESMGAIARSHFLDRSGAAYEVEGFKQTTAYPAIVEMPLVNAGYDKDNENVYAPFADAIDAGDNVIL